MIYVEPHPKSNGKSGFIEFDDAFFGGPTVKKRVVS